MQEAPKRTAPTEVTQLRWRIKELETQLRSAYLDRLYLLAVLAADPTLNPRLALDADGLPGFRTVLFLTDAACGGQISFHVADADLAIVEHVPWAQTGDPYATWDGADKGHCARPAPRAGPTSRRCHSDERGGRGPMIDSTELLEALLAEAGRRGYPQDALYDVTHVNAAQRLLGMDDGRPWHRVRVMLPSDTFDDAIHGGDSDQALANAAWNWPTATSITLLPASPEEHRNRKGTNPCLGY